MARPITLRQVEIFKAFVEHGTVSRAAEILNISQPSASKALMHFETDCALRLFERKKSRLLPTPEAMRLYAEVDRIFAGIRQIENAITSIRSGDQGGISMGVLPALADAFVERVTTEFRVLNRSLVFSFRSATSRWISEHVLSRELDIGLINAQIDDPLLAAEPVFECPLVCVMPNGHPLAARDVILPDDLHGVPYVALDSDVYFGNRAAKIFERYKVKPQVVVSAATSHTVRHFVATGYGVSLLHPLFIVGVEDRVVVRPFEPQTSIGLLLCFARNTKKEERIAEFAQEIKVVGERLARTIAEGI